jgi:hypothetical protein
MARKASEQLMADVLSDVRRETAWLLSSLVIP